jgi:hypothetical protein
VKTISLKKVSAVAVASLGFGLLSVVPANAANSAGTAAIGPVRVSFIGSTQDGVNAAAVAITADADWAAADFTTDLATITVALTTAPSAAATITIAHAQYTDQAASGNDTSVTLADDGAIISSGTDTATFAGTTAGLTFAANAIGTYTGTITVDGKNNASSDLLVVPFTFTTTGAVASYTFTSDVASSAVSGAVTSTVTLLDAAGKTTQASTVDTFALTVAIAGTATVGTLAAASATAADLTDGVQANIYTNSVTAGSTSTLTATPQGTLGTLAAKTLTITTVAANTGVPSATVTASNTIIKSSSSTSILNKYTVSANQTSVTFNVTGLTPNTSFTYSATSSGSGTIASVNAVSYSTGTDTTVVSSATGTYAFAVISTSPTTGHIVTLDLNGSVTDVTGQVDADITYAVGAFTATVTTPAAASLNKTSAAITYTGKVADQFGNPLAGATVTATGTPTPTTSPSTITATAVTAADGTYTVTLAAVAATTTSLSTVISATGTASIASASANVAYFTATGIAATLVLTDSDTASTGITTTDNISSRTIPLGRATTAGDMSNLTDDALVSTDNVVGITPQTTLPASVGYSVTATNGIRLFTSDQDGALGLANTAAITGTGGTAFYAVPTKAGAGVITVVSGGITQTFTLTGLVAAAPRANLVTLTAEATAGSYTVTTTDAFGNGVAATVAITVTGPGEFSNGFKNLSVTTAAVTGKNTFSIVSDGSASTVISASVAGDANYTAITSTEVTTYGLLAASAAVTATLTGKGGNSGSATLAGITAMIDALNAKIVALNALIAKIMRKLGVK